MTLKTADGQVLSTSNTALAQQGTGWQIPEPPETQPEDEPEE